METDTESGHADRNGHRTADRAPAPGAADVAHPAGPGPGKYLDNPWSRQAVHQAERGRRAFTAAEMAALALVLDTPVPALFLADAAQIELPGATVSAEDYQGILLHAGHDAPLDGIEELLVALHDITQTLSRPALARLAKDRTGSRGSRRHPVSATAPASSEPHAPSNPVPAEPADDTPIDSRGNPDPLPRRRRAAQSTCPSITSGNGGE